MGNCQAIDTASLIIQHPNGKVERLFWPVNARHIMNTNPGHCVALFISSQLCTSESNRNRTTTKTNDSVRLTRIKLLKPTDSLVLGQVYRLVTTQEVLQGLRAKKEAKMKKYQLDLAAKDGSLPRCSDDQTIKHERNRTRKLCTSTASTATKSRTWQPSLQSISEAGADR